MCAASISARISGFRRLRSRALEVRIPIGPNWYCRNESVHRQWHSHKDSRSATQALVMTPQLMQAIKLLQLSSLDLAAYVDAELEKNPLLEPAGGRASLSETRQSPRRRGPPRGGGAP